MRSSSSVGPPPSNSPKPLPPPPPPKGKPSPPFYANQVPPPSPKTDSVLFLLVSLTFIATILYLPGHVSFILDRAWFYAHGDAADAKDAAARTLAHALAAQSTAAAAAVAAAETVAELVREEL